MTRRRANGVSARALCIWGRAHALLVTSAIGNSHATEKAHTLTMQQKRPRACLLRANESASKRMSESFSQNELNELIRLSKSVFLST